MPVLDRATSVAADFPTAIFFFRQKVEHLRPVAVLPSSPVSVEAGDILGRTASRDGDDEEEPPRIMRRSSSSVDADGRGPARG